MDYSHKQIKIMEAAEKLFAAKGFEGSSVREIAEAAGINLAMTSYYFGSKEKLMEALFSYRSESFKLQLETMIRDTGLTPIQKVDVLIDQYIDRLMNLQSFHRIMVREQMVNNTGSISGLIRQLKIKNLELFHQLIHEGQKKGEFKKGIDIPLLMMTLIGTVSQMITTQHYFKEINELQSLSDEAFQTLIRKKLSHHLKKLFKAILTHEA